MTQLFKALSDPTRRQVLKMLRKGPLTAGELADAFPVSRATMSAHFSVLREADLISAEKDGREVFYRLNLTVLEDGLLGFSEAFGIGARRRTGKSGKVEA